MKAHVEQILIALGFDESTWPVGMPDILLRIQALRVTAAEVEELRETNAMACEQPADDCHCAGCMYADEVNARDRERRVAEHVLAAERKRGGS